jgi:hypothetical protein
VPVDDSYEFAALEQLILTSLRDGAGEHGSAVFHVDLFGIGNPTDAMGFRDGTLVSCDVEAIARRLPFDAGSLDLREPVLALLRENARRGIPLHLLRLRYRREGSAWTRTHLVVQSLSERRSFLDARAPQEARICAGLAAMASDWRSLSLSWDDIPGQELAPGVMVSRKGSNRRIEATPEVFSFVEELRTFYRERGYVLEAMAFDVEGGPGCPVVGQIDDYYG